MKNEKWKMKKKDGRRRGEVSLDGALSKLGVTSRSEARELIAAGRVTVDGRPALRSDAAVVPERAALAIDGVPIQTSPVVLVALHKPRGVVTTRRDPEGRPTVYDCLRDAGVRVSAVGRLDLASTGLDWRANEKRGPVSSALFLEDVRRAGL